MRLKFLIIFLFVSCSSIETTQQQRRNVNELYQSSGIARYFLPQVPNWANRSETAACMRKEQVQYVDMQRFRQSQGFSYEMALQFQLVHHLNLKESRLKRPSEKLSAKEAENIFFSALDRVKSNITVFKKPSFKRVHLVWVDSFIKDDSQISKLIKFMDSKVMQKGHPVFISLCASYSELENFLSKHKLEGRRIRLIGYDFLSPYDPEMKLMPFEKLYLNQVFDKTQTLHLYTPRGKELRVFEGQYIKHSF